MLFKDGEKKWSAAGALPYPQLKVEVEKALR
jgi:hypothetical protein